MKLALDTNVLRVCRGHERTVKTEQGSGTPSGLPPGGGRPPRQTLGELLTCLCGNQSAVRPIGGASPSPARSRRSRIRSLPRFLSNF